MFWVKVEAQAGTVGVVSELKLPFEFELVVELELELELDDVCEAPIPSPLKLI
jgi:hypothetical protein